ncbi:J domain-containing protein CG6693-like [Contarinia nasturtii]|uniref:J domain-containing protein CG6693-like n=1 Tax=Contarinia nasturtii TaxID=265458 RepID=UPI0012D3AA7E|nr:J domain-containing protein CG6693-like [Contarinia nasturtii]
MNAEKYFGTSELYKILELDSSAPTKDVKTNYYRLALIYHPDRVPEAEKPLANEKFNILHQAYSILANPETKILYDTGKLQFFFSKPTIVGKWEHYVAPLTSSAIESARQKYQGSVSEETDIIREFTIGKGSMTHLFNTIPFMRTEDEARIIHVIKECMQSGSIPKISIRKMRR